MTKRFSVISFAAIVAIAVLATFAASRAGANPRLSEEAVVSHCQRAVKAQLVNPDTADFGVYTAGQMATPSTFSENNDWIVKGNMSASADDGTVQVVPYRCDVQPFNGATVATLG